MSMDIYINLSLISREMNMEYQDVILLSLKEKDELNSI